ncbi:hypothetical protein DFH09DRAFT_1093976 [Mycena vulgaris]|nr:hypothetical protein DFH09DRAFT_1093976 [Mycena vulgaris]
MNTLNISAFSRQGGSTGLPATLMRIPTQASASPDSRGSSPTLNGTPAEKTTEDHRRVYLSPLCFEDEEDFPPRRPSSAGATSRKRPALQIEEDEEEEEDEEAVWRREEEAAQRRRGTWTGARIIIPSLATLAAGAGGGGHGGGHGGGGGGPVHLWTDACNRKGDKARIGGDADIGKMPCGVDDCESCAESGGEETPSRGRNNCQTGTRKRPKNVGWRTTEEGPPITQRAGELLTGLLGIYSLGRRDALEKILHGPSTSDNDLEISYNDIPTIVASLRAQTNSAHLSSLRYMLTLVQLALNVDSLQADNRLKHERKYNQDTLTEMFAGPTPRKTFVNWLTWGKRLLLLCSAGTMYILPIISAMEMRTKITGESSNEADIISLATALRQVKRKGLWSMAAYGYLQTLKLNYNVPVPVGQSPRSEVIKFQDIEKTDTVLDSVEIHSFKLPARSTEWAASSTLVWRTIDTPANVKLAPVYKIKTPLQLLKTKSPLTKRNRNRWSEKQRRIAEKAAVASSLNDLTARLADLHAGGTMKPGSYVEINSSILEGQALYITDANDKLLSLLFTVPEQYRQMLINAIDHIHAVMPGEFKDEDSQRDSFKYLSCHYSWYARFGEKGKGAPTNTHPDNIRKNHEGRVNFEQRLPHQSKEALKKPVEHSLLAEAYTDFFELLRVALKHYLPDQYDEIHIYAESLPLGASSPAYPFGGFVININACSWAHRDEGDKIMCFIVAAGKCKGGQLCLYETGFSFDLQVGDVLAFPSCDLTHFNCHFKGLRTTLVLHLDRQGDSWVRDCNGWGSHVVRHE